MSAHLTTNPTSVHHGAALADYFDAHARGVQPDPDLFNPRLGRMSRRLSAVECATTIIAVPTSDPPMALGPVHEAVARVRTMAARGMLPRISAHTVAQSLQIALKRGHPFHLRHAEYGWALLIEADRRNLLTVTLASPDPDDPRRYRPVRLHERVTELAAEHHLRPR